MSFDDLKFDAHAAQRLADSTRWAVLVTCEQRQYAFLPRATSQVRRRNTFTSLSTMVRTGVLRREFRGFARHVKWASTGPPILCTRSGCVILPRDATFVCTATDFPL